VASGTGVGKASDLSFVERESKQIGQTKTGYLLGLIKSAKKDLSKY